MKPSQLWQDTFYLLAGGRITRCTRPGEPIAAPTPDSPAASYHSRPKQLPPIVFFVASILALLFVLAAAAQAADSLLLSLPDHLYGIVHSR